MIFRRLVEEGEHQTYQTLTPKKNEAGKLKSKVKFFYYLIDFLIGNIKITKAKIKSTLVLIERYYYDYLIDKLRYNLDLSDGFLAFWEHIVLKPDVIFILTGDTQTLLDRKYEISFHDIEVQKKKLIEKFKDNPKAIYIDTTNNTLDVCIDEMIDWCNQVMRDKRKW